MIALCGVGVREWSLGRPGTGVRRWFHRIVRRTDAGGISLCALSRVICLTRLSCAMRRVDIDAWDATDAGGAAPCGCAVG